MQTARVLALCVLALVSPGARGVNADPMAKVFKMLDELKAKIAQDGENAARTYKKFFDWCDDEASELRNQISDATAKKADLEGTIKEKTSAGEVASVEIENLAASVSKDTKELKEATAMREKEMKEFATSEADLEATINTLDRAIGVIEKQGAAVLAQMGSASVEGSVAALRAIIDAASFRVADKERLLSMVQARQASDDDDEAAAPQGAGYQKKSGGVVDLLNDLKDEAEGQLSDVRKAETTAAHNFAKLKKSLSDSIKADTAGGEEAKAAMAAAQEAVASAEGELDTTVKALKEAEAGLAQAHSDCISAAADHEKSVTSRAEELKVIDEAKKILKEATGGAFLEKSYSFVQVAIRTRHEAAQSEIMSMVRNLAKEHHSAALAQLVSKISSVVRYSARTGADPFAKIKNLIDALITKLQKEAAADAQEMAWCDEQMTKTGAKKAELEEDIQKLSTKIDKATSKSVELKDEADKLQAELAELVKSQGEMDDVRSEEHAEYLQQKAVLESGLAGVRKALDLLRDYYGGSAAASLLQGKTSIGSVMRQRQPAPPANHGASGEAGGAIINILEVCESDFADGLSKLEMEEFDAESEYQKMTQENKMSKMMKEGDVKYKSEAATKLVAAISDFQNDLKTEKEEYVEVMKYYTEVKARCVAKPDPYEEQKAKRDAQIKGLKDALNVLENETAFVQRRKAIRSHNLRQ